MGTPMRFLMPERTFKPSAMPGPRNDFNDVRFALSYEALKMKGTPHRAATFASDSAIIDACVSLSITQGPAISARGAPPPIGTLPAITRAVSAIRRCRPPPAGQCLIVFCADGLLR